MLSPRRSCTDAVLIVFDPYAEDFEMQGKNEGGKGEPGTDTGDEFAA